MNESIPGQRNENIPTKKKAQWYQRAFGAFSGALFGLAVAIILAYWLAFGVAMTTLAIAIGIVIGSWLGFVYHGVATALFEILGAFR